MVYFLAVAAALSNALTSVLQRMGVEDAKEEDTLRLSLMTHALRRGVWLAGFGLMIGSFLLQALALHLGDLTEVQPILVTELLFLVFILSTWFDYRIGPREWFGVVLATAGLAGFLYFSSPTTGGNVAGQPRLADRGLLVRLSDGGYHRPRPSGSALVAGGDVRYCRGHRLCVHRRADQGGDPLRRRRLAEHVPALADLRRWPSSA